MNMLRISVCVAGFLAFAQTAHAQVPFFFPNQTAFTPQISIVSTGVELDTTATVSADRKYVTMTMRPSNSTLLALRAFTFQNAQQNQGPGMVGDPPRANPPAGRSDAASSAVRTSPSDILNHAKEQQSILHRSGMTRVSGLKE